MTNTRHEFQYGTNRYELCIKVQDGTTEYELLIEKSSLNEGLYRYITKSSPAKTKKEAEQVAKAWVEGVKKSAHQWVEEVEQITKQWVQEVERAIQPYPKEATSIPTPVVEKQHLSPIPPVRGDPTTLKITKSVFNEIRDTIGSRSAETGGPLGGNREDYIVEQFLFDRSAQRTEVIYTPDIQKLNPYIRQHWNEFGIYLLGFVHSHPSGWRPSTGDEIYARRILAAIPDMPYLLLPIVQTIPNTGSFQIHPYAAKRNGDNIAIIKLDLEIVENTGGFYTL